MSFRGRGKYLSLLITLLLSLFFLSGMAFSAETQTITIDPAVLSKAVGEDLTIAVNYEITNQALSKGLQIRIHYDSKKLTFLGFENIYATDNFGKVDVAQDDTVDDLDGDVKTDKQVNVLWTSFTGVWPGDSKKLLDVKFKVNAGAYNGTTSINLSNKKPAPGFSVAVKNMALTVTGGKDAPKTPVFSMAAGYYKEAISVTADVEAAPVKTFYTLDGTAPSTSSTEYTGAAIAIDGADKAAITLKMYSTDTAEGVSGDVASAVYTFDKTAPVAAFTAPVADAYKTSAASTITGTATDVTSGVEKVEVSIDDGTTWAAATGTATWTIDATLAKGANKLKVRVTDNAGNESVAAGNTLTFYPPLTLTIDGADVTNKTVPVSNTVPNNVKTITVAGGSVAFAGYVWAPLDSVVGTLTDGASAEVKTYTAKLTKSGTHKITVTDPADAMYKAEVTFNVVDFSATGPANIELGEAYNYTAVGATGDVTWTVTEGADVAGVPVVSADMPKAAITPVKAGSFKLKATDAGTGISSTVNVTVFKRLAVTDKPAETLIVESGASSAEFAVTGGDSSFTWSVAGPVAVAGGAGAAFTFTAPAAGDFAGEYTVTVTDGKGFSDSFKIRVPLKVVADATTVNEHDIYNPAAKGKINFTVTGSSAAPVFEILAAMDDAAAVADPALYGTFTVNALESADITKEDKFKEFYVRAKAGTASGIAGPFKFVAVVDYTVTVKDTNQALIEKARVSVTGYYDTDDDPVIAKRAKETDAAGKAVFALPAVGTFEFEASAVGFNPPAAISTDKTAVAFELKKFDNLTFTYTATGAQVVGNEVFVSNIAGKNTVSITVAGGSGNYGTYDWAPLVKAGVGALAGDVATPAVKTYTAEIDVEGTHAVTVYDPISKDMFTSVLTFKVVDFSATGPANIEAGKTYDYTAVGATGDVSWTVTEGADVAGVPVVSADMLTAAITPVKAGTFKLEATDARTGISSTVNVTVFERLAVTDKPAETVVVESGASSAEFAVTGGDSSFTWSVSGPVAVAGGTGGTYTFAAPDTGNFAGEYTVTVTDGKGFIDSFKIGVPFKVAPEKKNVLEHDLYDSTKKGTISFAISGSTDTVVFEILEAKGDSGAVADSTLYGTFTGNDLESADISDEDKYKEFFVRATIGQESHVVGPFRFIAVVDYKVTVKDKDETIIDGATVSVDGYYDGPAATGAPKLTDAEGEATFALPATGTFEFQAAKTGFIENSIFSDKSPVALVLEKAGSLVVEGTVKDQTGAPVGGADVVVYKDQNQVTGKTDPATGGYSIVLPVDAVEIGWKAVASKDGYYLKDPVDVPDLSAAPVADTDLILLKEAVLGVTVADDPVDTTKIVVSLVAELGSTPLTASTDVEVYNAEGFDAAAPVEVADKELNAAGDAVLVRMDKKDFILLIKPGTTRDDIQDQTFKYTVGEAADSQKPVTQAGAEFDNGKAGDRKVTVNIPANGVSKPATLEIRTLPKNAGKYTDGTPAVYVEINAIDNETGKPLDAADINRIEITIPFDTAVVKPGDFATGNAFIYYADTSSMIDSGDFNVLPRSNIILQDDLAGHVRFFVDHLTVYAVGTTVMFNTTGPTRIELGKAYKYTASGAAGEVSWTVTTGADVAGTLKVSADKSTATITPVKAGNFVLQATDAGIGNSSTLSVTVVLPAPVPDPTPDPPYAFSATGPAKIDAGVASKYTATGAVGSVKWTVIEGADVAGTPLVSTDKLTVTITAVKAGKFKLQATDTGTGKTFVVDVTASEKLAVIDKPAKTVVVQSGKNSDEYAVAGGDSNFTWTVTGPVAVAGGKGPKFIFAAPATGNFAGEYTVTVKDGKGVSDSFKVRVPFGITPEKKDVFEHDLYDRTNKGTISFVVMGSVDTVTFEILAAEGDSEAVADPTLYGTFTGSDLESADISGDVKYKEFFVRAAIGEESHVVGPFRFIAVVDYTVTLKDKDGNLLDGATVGVKEYYYNYENPGANNAPKMTNAAGEAIFALPAIGTFEFEAAKTGFITNSTMSSEPSVALVLEKGSKLVVKGTVKDQTGAPVGGADVVVYKDQNQVTGKTDPATGGYSIVLPVDAVEIGWMAVAAKEGYYFKTPVAVPDLSAAPVADTNMTLFRETELVFAVTPDLADTGKVTVTIADASGLTPLTAATDIKVYNAKGFDPAAPVDVPNKAFDPADGVVSFPMVKEDFILLIKPGRADIQNQIFRYIVGETADRYKVVTQSGAEFDNGKQGKERVSVKVPANGILKPATLEIRTLSKKAGDYTNGTPAVYVEINAFDNETGKPLDQADIKRIEIAIPYDTAVINSGDFKAGKAFIYYADTVSIIESGAAEVVPTANIISQDHGNGQVLFFVDHLTVFAIGTKAVDGDDGGGSSGCFITTVASGSAAAAPLAALIGMFAACGVLALKRRK